LQIIFAIFEIEEIGVNFDNLILMVLDESKLLILFQTGLI